MLVLLVDAFSARKAVLPWVAAAGLVAAAAVALGQWVQFKGGLRFSARQPEAGFNHMVALDKYALFFIVLSAAIGVLTIMLSDAYVNARGGGRGEFYALLLFVIAGMVAMSMATDLIAFFVALSSCPCRPTCWPASCVATYDRARPRSSTSSTGPSPRLSSPSASRCSTA